MVRSFISNAINTASPSALSLNAEAAPVWWAQTVSALAYQISIQILFPNSFPNADANPDPALVCPQADGSFEAQVAKQVLWAHGTSYILHEIFGIDRNPESSPAGVDDGGNKVRVPSDIRADSAFAADAVFDSFPHLLIHCGAVVSCVCVRQPYYDLVAKDLGSRFWRFTRSSYLIGSFFEYFSCVFGIR